MFNNQLSAGDQPFNSFNQQQSQGQCGGVEEIDLTDEPNKDSKDRSRGGDNRRRKRYYMHYY
jgi:hypothetical protein